MERSFLSGVLLSAFLALPLAAQPATVEIPVAMTPAQAIDLVQLAALRGGWTVASSTERMVTLDTYKPKGHEALNVELKANIIASGDSSIIVLSGLWSNDVAAIMHGNKSAMGKATDPITGPPFKRLNRAGKATWAELERFAETVKAAR